MQEKQVKRNSHPLVFISWMGQYSDDTINALAHRGGRGPIRVYDKDRYNPKILPYFQDADQALIFMYENRGKQCQVDLRAARELGFDLREMANLRVA